MEIKNAKFITSAATEKQFIKPDKPMIAVCGKSNSGKSTLINLLAGQKRLAKTSAAPGRTRLVNYFDFGEFLLADLPGYGYAAVSREEKAKWAKTLDAFFSKQEDITHVLVLSDIRREPSDDDMQMLTYLNYYRLPFTVVATKCDKLSRMQQNLRKKKVAQGFGLGEGNVIAFSGISGEGKKELLSALSVAINRSKMQAVEEEDSEEE